ncbi:cytochrome b-245 chaperone 1 homolog [Betta splendens]|uniref:Essential for reactive oxygen species protein n=1 Tax=Betta splendens TaxID=158456 RepID=A0A6P7L344_BETSP|nr:cytochrome b-245 chaperone 1 homolog [Betta splendens]XP_028989030.1 cytochrome b-245 chaperone 1 homolog [Betta splendens]XP_055360239.1 cytochrome b-245 chaperone 1 homolog [Betta splendens]
MGYMTVEEHSSTLLHLKRSPGIRSWSLLFGITSVGLAAAYYSSDSIMWKLFYVTGCLFVALQNMDEWEEAMFDKSKNLIEIRTSSLYTLVLTLWRKGQEKVVLDLNHLCDICVQEEKVRYLGKGYVLMLRLAAGFSYPLTQSATLGGRSDVEAVAALLKRFVGLDELQKHRREEDEDHFLDSSSHSDNEEDEL